MSNMKKGKMEKKGISPLVSTILLIMIAIVLALIIIIWSTGFVKEAYSKTVAGEEKPVEYYCSQLSLESINNQDGSFGFSNQGTVPVYSFKLKLVEDDGSSTVTEIEQGVGPGSTVIVPDKTSIGKKEITIIPVLLAKKKSAANPEPVPCASSNALKIL